MLLLQCVGQLNIKWYLLFLCIGLQFRYIVCGFIVLFISQFIKCSDRNSIVLMIILWKFSWWFMCIIRVVWLLLCSSWLFMFRLNKLQKWIFWFIVVFRLGQLIIVWVIIENVLGLDLWFCLKFRNLFWVCFMISNIKWIKVLCLMCVFGFFSMCCLILYWLSSVGMFMLLWVVFCSIFIICCMLIVFC